VVTAPRFTVDRLWPDPAFGLDLDTAFADLAVPEPPAGRALLAVNMVTSIDGRAQLDGSAEGLGSRADRRLMRLLRVGHDAVASGAGTLRAADFWSWLPPDLAERRRAAGRPPQPVAIVIGGRWPIPADRRWFAADQPRLLVVGAHHELADGAGPARQALARAVEVIVAPSEVPEPGWLLRELRSRGVASVLLEGGPTTNAAFLAARCVDELYWTIGPRLVANDGLPMVAPVNALPSPVEATLVSAHRHGDELYLRYRLAAG
jgi:2,5-diamino-6-(ribosylamino)-4(3H)-pyrimidinone 5'-phosphate reductase